MGFTELPMSPPGLVRFYRTVSPVQREGRCSLLSVALSIASPLLGVTQHPAQRSPDFPHPESLGTRSPTQLKPEYDNTFLLIRQLEQQMKCDVYHVKRKIWKAGRLEDCLLPFFLSFQPSFSSILSCPCFKKISSFCASHPFILIENHQAEDKHVNIG